MNDELKQSNFRKTIADDDYRYSIKKVAMAGLLTIALLFLMKTVPFMAYIAYPVALVSGSANEMVANLAILAYLLVLSYLLLYFFVFRKLKRIRKPHLPCPYCSENIKVFKDWKCDKCGKLQGVEKYITEGCFHCGKMLDTYSCENCRQKFVL